MQTFLFDREWQWLKEVWILTMIVSLPIQITDEVFEEVMIQKNMISLIIVCT